MDMKELYIAANLLDAALCTVEDHPELASLQLKIVAAVHEIEALQKISANTTTDNRNGGPGGTRTPNQAVMSRRTGSDI